MDKCKTIFLLISCGIFLLIGLIAVLSGAYLAISPTKVDFNLEFDDAKKNITNMFKKINNYTLLRNNNPPDINNADPWPNTQFHVIVRGFGIFLCIFGVMMCGISILGIAAIWKTSKRLTVVFVILMILWLLTEIAMAVIYLKYSNMFVKYVDDVFLKTLDKNYYGLWGKDEISMAWNIVMKKLDCCGIHNYTDVQSSTSFNDTWLNIYHSVSVPDKTEFPLVCCSTIEIIGPPTKYPGPCHKEQYIFKKGCIDIFWEELENYRVPIIVFVSFSSLFQFVQIITLLISFASKSSNNELLKIYPKESIRKKHSHYPEKIKRFSEKEYAEEEKWYRGIRPQPMKRPLHFYDY